MMMVSAILLKANSDLEKPSHSAGGRAGLWGRTQQSYWEYWCHSQWVAVPGRPQVPSSIPLSCIRAVERVDEGAFQLPHVMQVVTQDGAGVSHTTYLQCKVRCGAQPGVGGL